MARSASRTKPGSGKDTPGRRRIKRAKQNVPPREKTVRRYDISLSERQGTEGANIREPHAAIAKKIHPLDQSLYHEGAGILERLRRDHVKVQYLCETFQTSGGADKSHVAHKIMTELETHARVEEELFYPEISRRAEQEGKQLVREAMADHEDIGAQILTLKTLDPEADAFTDGIEQLIQHVQRHVEDEERELFPLAEDLLAEELERLGETMDERKTVLLQILSH
ncbi:MAG: hemerythrin domain-containing protein [Nitrospira sp.]